MKSLDVLYKRQNETLKDIQNNLDRYGKCAVVRGTGFGKTYLLSYIVGDRLKKHREDKVLYLYPTYVVKKAVESYIGNLIREEDRDRLDTLTYYRFGIKASSEKFVRRIANTYSLIIFDEMHCLGANNVKNGMYKLLEKIKGSNVQYIGATATPLRLDGFNVIKEFFNGHYTKSYSIDDMIEDKLIEEPYYIFNYYENVFNAEYIKNKAAFGNMRMSTKEAVAIAKEVGEIFNASNIIRSNIKKVEKEYNIDTDYMKFICFFLTKDRIEKDRELVRGYFEKAFPDKRVCIHILTSNIDYRDNLEHILRLKPRKNTIDLILSINMLNLGYHVDNITGIVMFRNTSSPIIYSQQIGRSISVNSKNPAIIFDFVQNMKTNPLWRYDVSLENDEVADKEEMDEQKESVRDSASRRLDKIMKCSLISRKNIRVIDEVQNIESYISKIEAIPQKDMTNAIRLYTNINNEMGVEDVARYYGAPIEKPLIRALKKFGIKLWEWDIDEWGGVYESA